MIGGQTELARRPPFDRLDERLTKVAVVAGNSRLRNRLVLDLAAADQHSPTEASAESLIADIGLLADLVLGHDATFDLDAAAAIEISLDQDRVRLLVGALLIAGLNRTALPGTGPKPRLEAQVATTVSGLELTLDADGVSLPEPWLTEVAAACSDEFEFRPRENGWTASATVMRLDLPAEPTKETPALTAGNGTILVVDDDPGVRNIFTRALQLRSFEVLAASSCEEALALAETAKSLQLLLTDARLGEGGDGLALASAVVERWPDLPVIVASGYPQEPGQHLPPNCQWLQKPVPLRNLQAAVEAMLDTRA